MKTHALNQWYGSARMASPEVIGRELDGCSHVTIPCGGGLCEVPFIRARSMLIGDLHRHMINLARVVRDPVLCPQLVRALKRTLFHPDELRDAQERCRLRDSFVADEVGLFVSRFPEKAHGSLSLGVNTPDLQWAIDYFICSWMGQGGRAGTKNEFDGSFSFRRNANGGGSSTRFHSMVGSLVAWRRELKRCEFVVQDLFEMIEGVAGDKSKPAMKDETGLGLYLDPPWFDDGDDYKHPFTHSQHRCLARAVQRFQQTRVVIRYGDHPLIRELYGSWQGWTIIERVSRTQKNKEKKELLIINGEIRSAKCLAESN